MRPLLLPAMPPAYWFTTWIEPARFVAFWIRPSLRPATPPPWVVEKTVVPFCTVMDMLVGVLGSWPIVPDAAFKPATPPVWVVPLTFTVTLLAVTVPRL